METFRVRYSEKDKTRTLLLPLSLGACSVALLHILSNYLKGQVQKTGRTGFVLHILHVEQEKPEQSLLDTIKARYPEHSYSSISISNAMGLSSIQDVFPQLKATPADEQLSQLLAMCDSASSRVDLLNMLRTKLIVSHATEYNCESVIWGHSTTRLAEQTLAETAKGRGYALHLTSAEGASPFGIPFHYPFRDLLGSEIESFANLLDPPLQYAPDRVQSSVSSKHTTIDSLMQQYFASVEKDHPLIVANVVRTASKLQGDPLSLVEKQCELCEMPLQGNAPQMSRLCNACIRIMPG